MPATRVALARHACYPVGPRRNMKIVRTKILPPPLQPRLVTRRHLVRLLEDGLRTTGETADASGVEFARAVTLVCAPTGYGKTTGVRLWTSSLAEQVAWYTVDSWDNDARRFWMHLAHAVRAVAPEFGHHIVALFDSSAVVAGENAAAQPAETAAEELADIDPTVLVLDDFHEITATEIHAQLQRLVELLPPCLHLVVTTRHEPPWPWERWRARGTLLKVSQEDLRFTEEESDEFLTTALADRLTDAQRAAIHRHMEGWATGLHLSAACGGRHGTDGRAADHAARDFLLREIVDLQPPDVREFLRQTSFLPRLTPELCDSVTGRHDSRIMLERLERDGLFLQRLADEGPAYRYHGVFASAIAELQPVDGEQTAATHRRVARALARDGEIGRAVEHAFTAEDAHLALELIATDPRKVWEEEGPARAARWISAIPVELFARAPLVAAYRAVLALVLGEVRELPALIEQIEKTVGDSGAAAGLLALVRAYLALFSGSIDGVRRQLAVAAKQLPETDTMLRSMTELGRGDLAAMEGAMSEAAAAYGEALALGRRGEHAFAILHAGWKLANLHWQCGRLTEALIVCDELDRYVTEHRLSRTPRVGPLKAVRAAVLRERGALEEATALAHDAVALCGAERMIAAWCRCVEAMVRFSSRDPAGALESIAAGDAIRRDSGLPGHLVCMLGTWKARIYLALGDADNARECLDAAGINPGARPRIFTEEGWLVHARVLILDGRTREAASVIDRVEELAQVGNRKPVLIETMLVKTRVSPDTAAESLERAVEIASTERISQRFVDERSAADETDPVLPLLKRLTPGRPWARFAAELMRGSSGRTMGEDTARPLLSDREQEVVQLMERGKSNQEIADELFLSVGTVKWHTTNIFSKLMVSRRTEAIARARELGLLPNEKT